MTHPAEVASNWDWSRLNSRVRGLREASVHVYRRIVAIQEVRQAAEEKAREAEARAIEDRDAQQQTDLDAALAEHDPYLDEPDRRIDDEPEAEQ
ncbi:hypothetical protein [Catenuloplanes japonicus]|uniref:hypothetical protein n=1 Tax=Catenuloplanes japonicus TaxID=33876 RepID=UPI000527873F|nr:hypothetical protein [Catenuloplanes japonicus]